ncbi:guanosine-3',5'-bis(diphosphate) protein [Leptolyngbya phage Lbo-JY46]
MLTTAIKIAATAFEGDYDKGGQPYIMHLLYVMHKVKHLGETAMICAVLHDLIEDKEKSGYNFEYLRLNGFSEEVILILQLLTHRKGTDYMNYIKGLSVHNIAKAIKKADLEHNSKVSRLKGLRKKDFDRLEKYCVAYQYLSE